LPIIRNQQATHKYKRGEKNHSVPSEKEGQRWGMIEKQLREKRIRKTTTTEEEKGKVDGAGG